MADAEIIQLGSRGKAGRGSGKTPSAAARGLASGGKPRSSGSKSARRAQPGMESNEAVEPEAVAADVVESLAAEPEVEDVEILDAEVTDLAESTHSTSTDSTDSATSAGPGAPDPTDDRAGIGDEDGTPGGDDANAYGTNSPDDAGPGHVDDPEHGTTRRGPAPPTVNLGAVVSELAGILGSALGHLRNVPVEQLRELGRDPLKAVLQIAESLVTNGWL